MITGFACTRLGNYDQMDVVDQQTSVRSVNLSDVTLDAITHHGLADFARYGKPQLSSLTRLPDDVRDKQRPARPTFAFLVGAEILASAR